MTLQAGQQIITLHLLQNISRIKGTQTTKFGQFIEYSMENIFLENSYVESGIAVSPRFFYEKSNSYQTDFLYDQKVKAKT